jgi:SWI/SNF-related matrix-associated actin-dependent regulator 1 of chromatin subfamily A
MILRFDGDTFYLESRYEEREVIKKAGFRWDKDLKRWWTKDPDVAFKMARQADEETGARLRGLAQSRAESIKASRSVGSDFNPPAPPGMSYLPFQRAGIAYGLAHPGVLLGDEMGCVDGEALVNINRAGKGFRVTLAKAYRRFHGLDRGNYNWDKSIITYIRSLCGKEIHLNRVIDIVDKGTMPVCRLSLASGKTIRLTHDHEVCTRIDNWVRVLELNHGDTVLTNGMLRCRRCGGTDRVSTYPYAKFRGYCRQCMYRYLRTQRNWKTGKHLDKTGYVMVSRQWDHPKHDLTGAVREHVLVMEKHLGRHLLPGEIVHHINGDRQDNRLENLELHTAESHQHHHGKLSSYRNLHGGIRCDGWEVCFYPKEDSVVSVEPDGEAHVYDVVCEDPHRNFIANGIIVHNCGKTVEALGIINALPESEARRVLVVCPASLKINWAREAERWLVRPRRIEIAIPLFFPQHREFVICNYDILARHHDAIRTQTWDVLIVDECHYLKSPRAQRTLQVVGGRAKKKEKGKLGEKFDPIPARRRLFLTGTPILNRPVELWTIVHALAPNEFADFWKFTGRYCERHQNRFGWDMKGASNLEELQEKLRASVLIRRLKSEVLSELPPKRRQIVPVDPEGCEGVIKAEKDAYRRHEAEAEELHLRVEAARASDDPGDYEKAVDKLKEAQQTAFAEMAILRHETARAKAPRVIEHVKECLEEEGKIVIFAHHLDVIETIKNAFPGEAVALTGEMGIDERQAAVDRFQKDPACQVFVGSIKAAGLGITLTASSHVVFAELDWVPASINQAEDRCHRIGAVGSVLVQHLVFDESLDADMAKMLVAKQAVIDQALDDGEAKNAP